MTRTSKIIAAGFLVRAFAAQALFWISYLRLPVARSLQLGGGFWFFAEDGPYYLLSASKAASHGLLGIATIGPFEPSRFFLQVIALLILALGAVASLAILINCAAYAITCAMLVRMKANEVVIAAIAFSPAALLFSLQLLKDTLFFLLIVLMVAAFRRWQELWRGDDASLRNVLVCGAAIFAIVFALAGIRWYFAVIVWGTSAILFLFAAWSAPRRMWALAAGAMLFILLAQSVRLGALDTPPQVARLLNPVTALQWKPEIATQLVAEKRYGFDTTPAATTIVAGPLLGPPVLETPDVTTAAHEVVVTPHATPVNPATAQAKPTPAGTKPTPTVVSAKPSPGPVSTTGPARLIAGFAATFLPRLLAQSLGLIHVGGGRGLWIFAEVDTIVFDLVLIYAIVSCARALRRKTARLTPLFLFLAIVFISTAGPMIYTVNNFGTIFRLRQMLYVMAAVLPVTLRKNE